MAARLRAILAFMTRLPVPIQKNDFDTLPTTASFFPLVGVVVGLGLFSVWQLLQMMSISTAIFRVPVILATYYLLCGGIHLDGVADVWDGMNCGGDREKVFQAMSDSCVGTFGVLGLIVAVGIAGIGISTANGMMLFLAPIFGRTLALMLISLFPAAKQDGLGKPMIDACGRKTALFSLLILIAIAWMNPNAILAYGVLLLVFLIKVHPFIQRIQGVTGDLIGFTIEMSQWIFLFVIQWGALQ